MAGQAVAEHLALLARSGLMTHVAQLDPPVTAAAMARFRADASAQSSNVMALSPGEFALCLPPSARALASTVPHRLRPIAEHPLLAGAGHDASQPLPAANGQRALAGTRDAMDPTPQTLAARTPSHPAEAAQTPRDEGMPQQATAFAFPRTPVSGGMGQQASHAAPPPEHVPSPAPASYSGSAVNDGGAPASVSAPDPEAIQAALSVQIEQLEERLRQMEHRAADAQAQSLQAFETRLTEEVQSSLAALDERIASRISRELQNADTRGDTLTDRITSALTEQAEEIRSDRAALTGEIAQALTAVQSEQRTRLQALADSVQSQNIAIAEDEARMTEGFATVRLGLRAMNDRLADLSARLVPERGASPSGAVGVDALPQQAPVQAATDGTPDAAVGALHQAHETANAPVPVGARLALFPQPAAPEDAPAGDRSDASAQSALKNALRRLLSELSSDDAEGAGAPAAAAKPATRSG